MFWKGFHHTFTKIFLGNKDKTTRKFRRNFASTNYVTFHEIYEKNVQNWRVAISLQNTKSGAPKIYPTLVWSNISLTRSWQKWINCLHSHGGHTSRLTNRPEFEQKTQSIIHEGKIVHRAVKKTKMHEKHRTRLNFP